jgi:protein MYSM1
MPLPGKVSESGAGYTLSGKPLDPESAAAKQYLGKRFLQKREENLKKGIKQDFGIENFNGERDNPLPTKPHEPVESTLAEAEKSDLSTSLPPKEESNDSVGAPEPGSGKKTSRYDLELSFNSYTTLFNFKHSDIRAVFVLS